MQDHIWLLGLIPGALIASWLLIYFGPRSLWGWVALATLAFAIQHSML